MPCAGTTVGEHCGGFFKLLVYEITAYQGCKRDAYEGNIPEGSLSLSVSADEQIIGEPWDFQGKIDTFSFMLTHQGCSSSLRQLPAGLCDV